MQENTDEMNNKPWWKHGYVWMILAGPIIVIIASFITLSLALKTPDPAIEDYYTKGININKTLEEKTKLSPALKARNHAATGVEAEK